MTVKRSWFFQNGLFYTILAFVLLIHLILLAARMYKDQDLVRTVPDRSVTGPPIKVKIVSDPRKVSIKKQIVQSQDPSSPSTPKDSAYLSDKNRQFDRETIAKKVDKFNEGGKGNAAKDISFSDLSTFEKNHHPLQAGAKAYAQARQQKAVAGNSTGDPLHRGVSSTNDFVDKVPLGDLTYLNTSEYKYYGFYFRIRQKLEQFWGRSIQAKAEAIMEEGRRIASNENLITSLEVTMDKEGEITAIAIKGSSGVKELDDAAVESFNQAGPFPNPPEGLLENGLVKIEYGFVVQTSAMN